MLLRDKDTNRVYFSPLIRDFACFDRIAQCLRNHKVSIRFIPYTKDYWVRDFMPVQLNTNQFVSYRYNPDYLQDELNFISQSITCCNALHIKTQELSIVLDGGNIIKCLDRIIMTDKVFVENPKVKKLDLINILEAAFGCEIVFIPWDKAEEYGHADGMVRYIEHNKIVLNNYNNFDQSLRRKLLKTLRRYFDVVELTYKTDRPSKNNWVYLNYLQVQDLILLPALGVPEDTQALIQFNQIFPGTVIEQINIADIAALGGGLNCISWNVKYD